MNFRRVLLRHHRAKLLHARQHVGREAVALLDELRRGVPHLHRGQDVLECLEAIRRGAGAALSDGLKKHEEQVCGQSTLIYTTL